MTNNRSGAGGPEGVSVHPPRALAVAGSQAATMGYALPEGTPWTSPARGGRSGRAAGGAGCRGASPHPSPALPLVLHPSAAVRHAIGSAAVLIVGRFAGRPAA